MARTTPRLRPAIDLYSNCKWGIPMAKVQKFSDIQKEGYMHPEAQKLAELVGSTVIIHGVDSTQNSGDFQVTYFHIGPTEIEAKWFYTTSKVLREQAQAIAKATRKGPVEAKLEQAPGGYYLFS